MCVGFICVNKLKSASSCIVLRIQVHSRVVVCHVVECETSPITIIRMCVLCTFEYNVQNNYISIAKHVERKE